MAVHILKTSCDSRLRLTGPSFLGICAQFLRKLTTKGFSAGNAFLQITCGSPAYVSPEIIREEPYTAAADLWSSGVLLYAMVCGQLPFDGDNLGVLLQGILSTAPYIPPHISQELRSLLARLLWKEARITVRQILEHPWVADYRDRNAIGALKVFDVPDDIVLGEMRLIGYDTAASSTSSGRTGSASAQQPTRCSGREGHARREGNAGTVRQVESKEDKQRNIEARR
jgi:serine/threonine protein kinase